MIICYSRPRKLTQQGRKDVILGMLTNWFSLWATGAQSHWEPLGALRPHLPVPSPEVVIHQIFRWVFGGYTWGHQLPGLHCVLQEWAHHNREWRQQSSCCSFQKYEFANMLGMVSVEELEVTLDPTHISNPSQLWLHCSSLLVWNIHEPLTLIAQDTLSYP